MRTRTPLVTAAVIAALALAGCGTAASTSTPRPPPSQAARTSAPPATAQPANPVAIVRQTRATVPASEVYGSRDMQGDLYADGSFPGREILC